ncbi:MAG TPA: prolipoprotein diacylglyceryl transferase family protein [Saprospiraceae bacterium]|nr:prolipoprotein diacylglyceryl transferase family protein [Saprospiraceae bacterium]
MWPDFSYILHDLLGTAPDNAFSVIKTFGLFLGLAFLASGYLLYLELKRKEAQGLIQGRIENVVVYKPIDTNEILMQSAINFVLFFKIGYIAQHFDQFKSDPAAVLFSTKGNLLLGITAFILTAAWYFYKKSKQTQQEVIRKDVFIHPHERVFDITGVAALFGLIGSKLFSVLENFDSFIKDPVGEFFSGSGLTIYGGLILAFIMVYRYVDKKGIRPLHFIDAAAPTLMIGYCVGRMGCQFSGDGDWGIINELAKPSWFLFPDSWWAYSYPHNVLNEGVAIPDCSWKYCMQLEPKVFPTPLYEVVLAGLITGILWLMRTRIHRAGVLFFSYCIFNGLERFFIEFIRVNPRYNLLGFELSQAQIIALVVLLIGISGVAYYWKKNIRQ